MKWKYEQYKLLNGMKVVLIPDESVYSVSISAKTNSGSALEKIKDAGLTHFLEHLSLTATEKWPDKKTLNQTAEWNGASFNAATGKEYLRYYTTTPYTKIEYGLEFINQVLYHTKFVDENIETERTVILDELAKNENNIFYCLDQFSLEKVIPDEHSYKNPIIGLKENLLNFNKKDFLNHYKSAHDPSKVLLSITGNFDIKKTKQLVDKIFSKQKSNEKSHKIPNVSTKSSVTASKKDKKSDLILSSLMFEGIDEGKNDLLQRTKLGLSLSILCGPSSSRLFMRLREKEGLLYGISSYRSQYSNHIVREIFFDQQPRLYNKTLDMVLKEINKFHKEGVSKSELDHFKEYSINRSLVKYDGVYGYAPLILMPLFKNEKVYSIEEMHQSIKKISTEEINEFISETMDPSKLNIIAYGNTNKGLTDSIIKIREQNKC